MRKLLLLYLLTFLVSLVAAQKVLSAESFEVDTVKTQQTLSYQFVVPATSNGSINLTVQLYRTDYLPRRLHSSIGSQITSMKLKGPNNFMDSGKDELIALDARPGSYFLDIQAPTIDYTFALRFCLGACPRICPLSQNSTFCSGNGGCLIRAQRCQCDIGVAFSIKGVDCASVGDVWVDPASLHIGFVVAIGVPIIIFFLTISLACYTDLCNNWLRKADFDPATMRIAKED